MTSRERQGSYIYAGLSGVRLDVESYDLGKGVSLEQTYAHLMAPFVAAFAPPAAKGEPHPAPWSTVKGGLGFDVHVQLSVPAEYSLGADTDSDDVIWWLAVLLRLSWFPYLGVPVLSSHPFSEIPKTAEEVNLRPLEVTPRMLRPPSDASLPVVEEDHLQWIEQRWDSVGRLVYSHKDFRLALQALDTATVERKRSLSFLAIWSGLEQLLGFGGQRLAPFLAAYLEPPGDERLDMYRRITKLYGTRNAAAHTAKETEVDSLISAYVLVRNVLFQIVDDERIPTQSDLENLLLCDKE